MSFFFLPVRFSPLTFSFSADILKKGTSDEIGESWRQKILAQPKVLKVEEYCMYFPLSELHG